jgi:hypothetical protein
MAGKKVPERRSALRPSEKELPERRSVTKIPLSLLFLLSFLPHNDLVICHLLKF